MLAEVQRSDKTRSRDSSYRERASKNARWHGTLLAPSAIGAAAISLRAESVARAN